MSSGQHRVPTRQDVINAYGLVLGREPESVAVVDELIEHAGSDWLAGFFRSGEFVEAIVAPLLAGAMPRRPLLEAPPAAGLVAWAAATLPLREASRSMVRRADSWPALYRALFADPDLRAELFDMDAEAAARGEALVDALAGPAAPVTAPQAEVELATIQMIRGWVIDTAMPERPVGVALYVDGHFVAAAVPSDFRADLQARFGGSGRYSFALQLVDAGRWAGRAAELRDTRSGRVLADLRLPATTPPIDAIGAVRRELATLRELLDRLEARLPDFHTALGYALDAYPDFYAAWHLPGDVAAVAGEAGTASLAMVIDATDASADQALAALASAARSRLWPAELVLVHDEDSPRVADAVARAAETMSIPVVAVRACEHRGWARALTAAVQLTSAPALLFVPGDARLNPFAVERLNDALGAGAELAYGDADRAEMDSGGRLRHSQPRFRTAFDGDLLRQVDCVGELIACRRARFEALGLRPAFDGARFYDMLLRASCASPAMHIAHVPAVLAHHDGVRAATTLPARMEALEEHLGVAWPGTVAERHDDALGATLPTAARLRPTIMGRPRVAVIVPTRDRLDLLGPCLASVTASLARAAVDARLIVVDNRSDRPDTAAFLASLRDLGTATIIPHDDVFNWAVINNRAAEAAQDAEVLIFLNNDTLAISPGCWLELTAYAARPEVGAVGARLLYADGSLQHAGVVLGEWPNFATHEGVGRPGSDPGYEGRHALVRQVSTVTGACLATRADLFRTTGGFDPLFPAEGNETDYCLRVRAAGYRVLYVPQATFYHFESQSRGANRSEEQAREGRLATERLRARWGERFGVDPFYSPHFDRLAEPCTRLQAPRRYGA